MKKIYILSLIVVLFSIGTSVNAQKQLIVNGDFESLVDSSGTMIPTMIPWIDVSNLTTGGNVVNATGAKNGLSGYSWAKASQNDVRRGQIVKVTPGAALKFSMNYKINGGTGQVPPAVAKPAFVGFYFFPSGENFDPKAMQADGITANYKKAEPTVNTETAFISPSFSDNVGPITPTADWVEMKMDVKVPAGVDSLFIEIFWHRTTLFLDDISLIDQNGTVGISSLRVADLSVFPTSATSQIILKSSASISDYSIFDLSGKLMLAGKLNNTVGTVNISSLKSGMYLVKAQSQAGTGVSRFNVVK